MARLLAVLAAIGMIAGAFVYRYGVPGGGGVGGAGGNESAAGPVVCATELGPAVCEQIPGSLMEPTATTADRLVAARSGADAAIGAWVAPGPWPAMVDDARRIAGRPLLFDADGTTVLASTQLVAVARKGELQSVCPDLTWKCLGDAAQPTSFRIASDPLGTPIGVFIKAAALGGFLGTTEYPINDLAEVPDASGWLSNVIARLAAGPSFGATSLNTFLITPSARVYVTTAAAAQGVPRATFDVIAPKSAATVAVTSAPAATRARSYDQKDVQDALVQAGWEAGPRTGDDGLPSPGVLFALRGVS